MGNNRTIHLMQKLAGTDRGSAEHRRFFFPPSSMGRVECFLRVCFSSMRHSSHSLTGVLRSYIIGGLIRYGQEQYFPNITFLILAFSLSIMIMNLASIQHKHVISYCQCCGKCTQCSSCFISKLSILCLLAPPVLTLFASLYPSTLFVTF